MLLAAANPPVLLAVLTGLLGLGVGGGVSIISVWLPRRADAGGDVPKSLDWRALRSRRSLLIGLAAAVLGVWATLRGGNGLMISATAILGWQLLLIAIVDAENFWLPDVLTWPLIATGLILGAGMEAAIPWSRLIGAVGGFAMLWLLAWLYRRLRGRDGLGGGDPFLFAGAGAWVGWLGLPSVLFCACATGLVLVLGRLLTRRKVDGGDRMPFGTFLAIGVWLTWVCQPLAG